LISELLHVASNFVAKTNHVVSPSGIYSCREKDLWKIKHETRTDGEICAVSTPGGNIYLNHVSHNMSRGVTLYLIKHMWHYIIVHPN
jgi:hypothetical protein